MGNVFYRNRFWYVRSLYDDYMLREFRQAYMFGAVLWIPFYFWGIHMNREVEVTNSHAIYETEFRPKRNRLYRSMMYEMFEMDLERKATLLPQIEEAYEVMKSENDNELAEDEDLGQNFGEDDEDEEDEDDE